MMTFFYYAQKSTSQDHATTPKDDLSEDDFDPALKEKLDRLDTFFLTLPNYLKPMDVFNMNLKFFFE